MKHTVFNLSFADEQLAQKIQYGCHLKPASNHKVLDHFQEKSSNKSYTLLFFERMPQLFYESDTRGG